MEAAPINSGRGEARRVNVVYFLSRDGRVEHPHLLQIHRFRRDRVRLRDVKRWLSEARGKEMPESFSWSYKRRYRGGYIWQDVMENDLITPVADDEYVLKGSELIPITSEEESEHSLVAAVEAANAQVVPPRDEQICQKAAAAAAEIKQLDELCGEMAMILKEEEAGARDENKRGEGCYRHRNKKRAKMVLLFNILRCKSARQTLEDASQPTTSRWRQGKQQSGSGGEGSSAGGANSNCCAGRGRNTWSTAGKKESAAAYKKPAATATCSQCGKPFKPPKLHSHMQSCKGFARRRTIM